MDAQPKYDIPWDLVTEALLNNSSAEEKAALAQWLSLSPANQSAYDRIRRTWEEGVEYYPEYRLADSEKAWKTLQCRLGRTGTDGWPGSAAIQRKSIRPVQWMNRWVAIAAVFLLMLGIAFWQYRERTGEASYETGAGQEMKLALSDGSSILLKPLTRITIPRSFNRQTRTVELDKGEAVFTVQHRQLPFIVDMGVSSVKDMGTRFTIRREEDSIMVTVSSGKVAFVKKENRETRELVKGMTLSFNIPRKSFGTLILSGSGSGLERDSLRFNGSSLQEVIRTVQQFYREKLEVEDSSLLQERLTADLKGLSFEDALKVICHSLNLQYAEKNGTWFLKSRE
ncbi:MAG TPA: FecR domain-containing protein [Chitinophagaceae bacterium]